jgi:hypothetical protein
MPKPQTPSEAAELIVRFLEGRSNYPQEWNDFVECRHFDPRIEAFRKRCDELDPFVNCPDPRDKDALQELRSIVGKLRSISQ